MRKKFGHGCYSATTMADILAGREGFEPSSLDFGGQCSSRLSYLPNRYHVRAQTPNSLGKLFPSQAPCFARNHQSACDGLRQR